MRLKSFYAKTMTEAMQMVRDSLGEDAIIVATREEGGGASVRVTAAVDNDAYQSAEDTHDMPAFNPGKHDAPGLATASPEPSLGTDGDYPEYAIEDENGAIFEALTEVCLRHSIPEDVTDQIIASATIMGLDEPRLALIGALESLYSFTPVAENRPAQRPLMMVGAPGAGKTLAVAKTAARAMMNGLRVAVITTDTKRAGGVEQLKALTDVMGLPLERAASAQELHQALSRNAGADRCVIDTAGVNPFDRDQIREVAGYLGVGAIEPILVLPAGSDPAESGDIGRIFATLGVERVIATRLDVTRRLGGLLAAAHQGNLAFANASNTAQVAEGMRALSPRQLGAWLMPETGERNSHTAQNGVEKV